MSETIRAYAIQTCSKCREALKVLRDSGLPFEQVDYFRIPFDQTSLRELIDKTGLAPRDLLRTREEVYQRLNLGKRTLTDEALIKLMLQYPQLIQRPIIERGDRAVVARSIEKIREILGQ